MIATAELPLIASAGALALVALTLLLAPRSRLAASVAVVLSVAAVLAPLALATVIDPARAAGRALWEWSAAGGPTIQASYRFDGIAAIGVAVGAAYAGAGLFGVARAERRHPLLPSAILALGLVFFALVVTDDLIAGTVVLGVLASITILATLAVAPLPATTRLAAYLAVGVQFFVLAALLLSRFGGASFRFDAIPPGSVSPGAILAASIGAALFAGLYPFIPWRFRALRRGPELERLRGVITMPAGVAASLLLLRLLGTTRGDITSVGLPAVPVEWRALAALLALVPVGLAAWPAGRISGRHAAIAALVIALLAAYPALHWAHLILLAALLSALYAAAVSLALPEQWDVVRYDVTLAAFWIALAVGTPTSIAGGLFILVADAFVALAESIWTRGGYVVVIAGSAATVTGLIVTGVGSLAATDAGALTLAIAGLLTIGALVLVHVGRRLDVVAVPLALDGLAAAAALGITTLIGLAVSVPLYQGVTTVFGRPFEPGIANTPLGFIAAIASATLLVVIARSLRPFMPDLAPFAARLRSIIAIADPVPAGHAAFAALDAIASRTTATFNLFEQRAGVWLATLLIIGVLVWSVR
ncbi:MAG TPA: hypothetical protein VGT60_04385 [Candidatus Limnocylindria bacterium]|nr:hypothetical protein [Candidatus Limnocylindria bacterium]